MKTKETTIQKTTFLAVTCEGYWGRGKTLAKALENARALGRTRRIKRGIRLRAFRFDQRDGDQLTADGIRSDARRGITLKGYEPGDFMEPFVDDYGGVNWRGERTELELAKGATY